MALIKSLELSETQTTKRNSNHSRICLVTSLIRLSSDELSCLTEHLLMKLSRALQLLCTLLHHSKLTNRKTRTSLSNQLWKELWGWCAQAKNTMLKESWSLLLLPQLCTHNLATKSQKSSMSLTGHTLRKTLKLIHIKNQRLWQSVLLGILSKTWKRTRIKRLNWSQLIHVSFLDQLLSVPDLHQVRSLQKWWQEKFHVREFKCLAFQWKSVLLLIWMQSKFPKQQETDLFWLIGLFGLVRLHKHFTKNFNLRATILTLQTLDFAL